MLNILLWVLCSCSRETPIGVQTRNFLAAQAETVVADKPEVAEEAVLDYLRKFNANVKKKPVIPGDGLTTVKYHTGVSHSSGGMVVNGSKGGDPTVPPDKSYYHEFHYDSEGKLSHTIENDNGKRALSNLFYYDGTNPMARICFVQGKYSYSDLAFYDEGGMYFKCRIAPDGNVLSGGLAVVGE